MNKHLVFVALTAIAFLFSVQYGIAQNASSWKSVCPKLRCVAEKDGVSITLNGVFFADSKTGWFVGDNSRLGLEKRGIRGRTSDGGKSWKTEFADVTSTYTDVAFTSETRGFIVGTEVQKDFVFTPFLLETSNSGKDWTTRRLGECPKGKFETIRFVSPDVGYIGGRTLSPDHRTLAIILRSTDGGKTWNKVYVDEKEVPTGQSIRSISFDPTGEFGVAVSDQEMVLVSRDRGATWSSSSKGIGSQFLFGAFVRNESEAWITADNGAVFRSTDKGATWSRVKVCAPNQRNSDLTPWFSGVIFVGNSGWVGGTDGLICATADGGRTWRVEKSPIKAFIARFEKFSSTIVAMGSSELLIRR